MRIINYVLLTVFLFIASSSMVLAVCGGTADAFWGDVKVNGVDAAAGTNITAYIDGVEKGSIVTTVEGEYGSEFGDNKLYVPGNTNGSDEGGLITFQVESSPGSGVFLPAEQTDIYECGEVKELDLTTACEQIPEFGLLTGLLAVGVVGTLFVFLRKRV